MAIVTQKKRRVFRITMYGLSIFLVFSIFFMPDYFGLSVINSQRATLILIWFMIFRNSKRRKDFLNIIKTFRYNTIILIYLFILFYTAVYRVSLSTIINPFVDQIAVLYTMIYLFRYELDTEKFLKIVITCAYVLTILGITEYFFHGSIFSLMETIPGMASIVVRSGQYRIMGPAHHALGYGLYLLIMFPIVCYDYRCRTISLLNRFGLVVLIIINTFLTGSRSTLGLIVVELVVIFLMSDKEAKKKVSLLGIYGIMIGSLIILVFYKTSMVQSFLVSVGLLFDTVFHTNIAESLGVNMQVYQWSNQYREYLPLIFKLDWINPLVGRGYNYTFNWAYNGYWISSIDNYYINQYVKVAYPGLLIQIVFYLTFFILTIKNAYFRRSKLAQVLFYSFLFYFINIWWVDVLGTLDYIFTLFALIYAIDEKYTIVHHIKNSANLVTNTKGSLNIERNQYEAIQ
ncbi:hypothetical protein NDGK_03069 [Clostridiales bacterium CHKCI001]|nr:hypothetical protein NDGK_03069 [Clostridiales bacterium CHKCI001]